MESELLRDGTSDDSIHIGYRRIRVMTQYDYLAISGPTGRHGGSGSPHAAGTGRVYSCTPIVHSRSYFKQLI